MQATPAPDSSQVLSRDEARALTDASAVVQFRRSDPRQRDEPSEPATRDSPMAASPHRAARSTRP